MKGLCKSFGYALRGIRQAIRAERNMKIHLVITAAVLAAGCFFSLARTEWLALVLTISLVLMAEMMNTALERLVDLVSPEKHPLAGQAKDIAAGAVLVAAGGAVIIGCVVFLPHLAGWLSGR